MKNKIYLKRKKKYLLDIKQTFEIKDKKQYKNIIKTFIETIIKKIKIKTKKKKKKKKIY